MAFNISAVSCWTQLWAKTSWLNSSIPWKGFPFRFQRKEVVLVKKGRVRTTQLVGLVTSRSADRVAGRTLPAPDRPLGLLPGVFIYPGVTFETRGGQCSVGINSAVLCRRRGHSALHAVPAGRHDRNKCGTNHTAVQPLIEDAVVEGGRGLWGQDRPCTPSWADSREMVTQYRQDA